MTRESIREVRAERDELGAEVERLRGENVDLRAQLQQALAYERAFARGRYDAEQTAFEFRRERDDLARQNAALRRRGPAQPEEGDGGDGGP